MSLARRLLLRAASLLLGVLLALACGELGVRLWRGRLLAWDSPRHDRLRLLRSAYPAAHDALLGYVPRPGARAAASLWGTRVTIDALGLRAHAPVAPHDERPPLLALGDSFTFGDEVDDDDTWPARLERRLGRRVWNAGVFGYGLDQVVLRAERLLDEHAFAGLIVAFIPDDVERCEFSYRFAAKPYFDVDGGRLRLRNVPVPEPVERLEAPALLARSHLVDFVMLRLARERWLAGAHDVVRVHERGLSVACLLVERLAARCARQGLPLWLVALGEPRPASTLREQLLRHAGRHGVATLDLVTPLADELCGDAARRAEFFLAGGHYSARGNAWVAERLARALAPDRQTP